MGELVDSSQASGASACRPGAPDCAGGGSADTCPDALRYPLKAFFVPGALNSLQDGRRRVESLDQLYDFVDGFNYRGITINSWQKENGDRGLPSAS
jgi:hypothetical protein